MKQDCCDAGATSTLAPSLSAVCRMGCVRRHEIQRHVPVFLDPSGGLEKTREIDPTDLQKELWPLVAFKR